MVFLLLLAVFIVILFTPMFFKVKFYFDLTRKKLSAELLLYGLRTVKITAADRDGTIKYSVNGGEIKGIKGSSGGANVLPAIKALKPYDINISVKLGAYGAASTALIVGTLGTLKNIKGANISWTAADGEETTVFASMRLFLMPIEGVIYGLKRLKKQIGYNRNSR